MIKKSVILFILLITTAIYSLNAKAVSFLSESVEALLIRNSLLDGSLSRFVKEAGTGVPIKGTKELIMGTLKGTDIDIEGFLSIRGVEAGSKTLMFSYLDFKSKEIEINIVESENLELLVELECEGVISGLFTVSPQARGQIFALNPQLVSNSISNRFLQNKLGVIINVNTDRYDPSADILNGVYKQKLVLDSPNLTLNKA